MQSHPHHGKLDRMPGRQCRLILWISTVVGFLTDKIGVKPCVVLSEEMNKNSFVGNAYAIANFQAIGMTFQGKLHFLYGFRFKC
jgi:hypothetical protein